MNSKLSFAEIYVSTSICAKDIGCFNSFLLKEFGNIPSTISNLEAVNFSSSEIDFIFASSYSLSLKKNF